MTFYYRKLGSGRFEPSEHVQGAWSPQEQHLAPISALVTHELERFQPQEHLQLAKLGFEVLGFLPLAETTVEVSVARPGRTIEQLAFTATVGGRAVLRGTAWRLVISDSDAVAGTHDPHLPGPHALPRANFGDRWGGGFIKSLEIRTKHGEPGRNFAWLRTEVDLVEEEPSSPIANYMRLVDVANGIATRVSPRQWMFPNVDLVAHFWRQPDPDWVGLDTSVSFGSTGVGLTSSVLHDLHGPLGRVEQVLTVRPAPASS